MSGVVAVLPPPTFEFRPPEVLVSLKLCGVTDDMLKTIERASLTGAWHTCDPAPEGTDCDFLLHVKSLGEFGLAARLAGWSQREKSLDYSGSDRFDLYELNKADLIVTNLDWFYDHWRAATFVAKRLNLLRKEDRRMLFEACCYGRRDTGERPKKS